MRGGEGEEERERRRGRGGEGEEERERRRGRGGERTVRGVPLIEPSRCICILNLCEYNE